MELATLVRAPSGLLAVAAPSPAPPSRPPPAPAEPPSPSQRGVSGRGGGAERGQRPRATSGDPGPTLTGRLRAFLRLLLLLPLAAVVGHPVRHSGGAGRTHRRGVSCAAAQHLLRGSGPGPARSDCQLPPPHRKPGQSPPAELKATQSHEAEVAGSHPLAEAVSRCYDHAHPWRPGLQNARRISWL